MNGKNGKNGDGLGGCEPASRLNLDRLERLAAQLRDRPEELARLVRELTLTTIDDVRDRLTAEPEESDDGAEPPVGRAERGDS